MGKEQAVRAFRGFTLIELMVTIAVLAILAALAGPAFGDFFQRYRLRGAADDVASLIATARAEAVARNRDVAVVFSGTGTGWCVGATAAEPAAGQAAPTAPTCTCSNDCRVGGRVMENSGANYSGVTMSTAPASFVFDRRNGAVRPLTAATTTFGSPDGRYSMTVQVSPLGRARLCVPSGSPAISGFGAC